MPLYFLHVKLVSRAKGGRVTRSAAYRAGERIRDERTGEVYNFSSRDDVVHKEIFLPSQFEGTSEAHWARDRSTLWNAAEHTDRRNARLGRELLVALPPELTAAQRKQLVRRFSQDLADRYQSGVDATIHLPREGADARHHHAHLLMTTRQITPTGLGERTALELSCVERAQKGLGPYRPEFVWARQQWERVTNDALKEAGLSMRVDHRGARARGLNHEPVPMIPQKVLYLERKAGVATKAGNDIRRRYRERVEARSKGPDELLRVRQKQREEVRQQAVERAQRAQATPKKISWSALTKEEISQRARARYYGNKASLREKPLEPGKAQRGQATSPEQRSVRRWLKWRARHEQTPEPSGVEKWLAWREAQKLRTTHPSPSKETDRKPKTRREPDYEPEL